MSVYFDVDSTLGSPEQKLRKINENPIPTSSSKRSEEDPILPGILSAVNPHAQLFQEAMAGSGTNIEAQTNNNANEVNEDAPCYYGTHWESMLHVVEDGPGSRSRDKIFLLSGNFSSHISWDGFISKMTLEEALTLAENRDNKNVKCVNTGLGAGSNIIKTMDDTVTVALDKGIIVTYDYKFNLVSKHAIHEGPINKILGSYSGQFVTSCSNDGSILQFDLKEERARRRIPGAHIGRALDLTAHPGIENANVFMSIGTDREIVTWDFKASTPGTSFGYVKERTPSALYWSSFNDNCFYVGTSDSYLLIFDRRNPKIEMGGSKVDVKEITRIKPVTFSPSSPSQGSVSKPCLAIVSNHNVLNVMEEENLAPIYQGSATHTGSIRDVLQINGKLYSIGYNHQELVQHHLEL